jgi:TRAP-type C4-dicarboxylate transport system permease small subunit
MFGFWKRWENLVTYMAMASTFTMMCLTTVDAAGRYLFNAPLLLAYEFTETYLMVATVFLGACCAYRGGGFIRVTFVVERLPRRVQKVLLFLTQILCFLLSLLFITAIIYQAPKAPFAITLDVLPTGPGYLIVLVGLVFMSLAMLLDLTKGKAGFLGGESPHLEAQTGRSGEDQ